MFRRIILLSLSGIAVMFVMFSIAPHMAEAINYGAGAAPVSVAIGDLDGDGDLDLAAANYSSDDVSVLLGNGDGTFQTAVNYGAGNNPHSVSIGDLDGDGDLDLAVANLGSDDVSVLLGNGNGTFQDAGSFVAHDGPACVAIGDLDGDGALDLTVANYFSDNDASVLLGNGDGTFQDADNYGAFDDPYSIAIGDLDGDGDLDLTVANRGSNNVSVLLGNGDGTFQSAGSYQTDNAPASVAIGYLDGDGDLDLAVANYSSDDGDDVSVLLGNGDGTFQAAVNYEAGNNPLSVAIGDLDGDGDLDLSVANRGSNDVSVLLGNGDGTFQAALNYGAGEMAHSVAIGDLDGDGDLDLAVANSGTSDVSVLLGYGDGTFPSFTVSAISGDTGEDGTQATFTVRLTSQPTADVTIGVSSLDTTEGTVDVSSLTFTPANWDANQTVTVTGEDDFVADGDLSYTIELAPATSGDPNYNGSDPADVAVINIDDETAGFTVSDISGDTGEDGTQATFTVMLNSEPTNDVEIEVSSSDETEGTVDQSSLTFTPANWDANQTVTVTGEDDFVADGDLSYTIELAPATSGDPNYNGSDPADVAVINIDDETAGFTVSDISGDTGEDGTQATFTVMLNSEPTNDVEIEVSSSDETEGTVDQSSLTFTPANWDANQTVTVTGEDDFVADGNLSYTIELAPATSGDPNYNGSDPADVAVINIDDETAGFTVSDISGDTGEDGMQATFTVMLNSEPTNDVEIDVSSSDETEGTVDQSSLTFTPANWDANQTVTVTGEDDFVADGDQSYTIELAPATSGDPNYNGLDPSDVAVINIDDETAGFTVSAISGDTGEDGMQATFTVRLTSQPTNYVIIGVSSLDTTEGTVDQSSLTFTPANWDADQTVTVTGVDDFVADGNQSYTIELAPATSGDPNYDGEDPSDVSVINIDDETTGFTVSDISGDTGEDGTPATFTVRLTSQPTNYVIIGVSSLDTTEGTVDQSSLTFTPANWDANQTVTVTGVDDFVADGNQSYTIELAPATSGDPNYDGEDPSDVSVINIDDETTGFTVSDISGDTGEDGTPATFTVRLTSQPTNDVIIDVSSLDTTEGTVDQSILTFTPANWDADQTVTVTGVDDFVADGNQSYTIELATATSGDPNYNGLDPADVAVINIDDEKAERSGGGGCFIAIASFGLKSASYVEILRYFREVFILPSKLGESN